MHFNTLKVKCILNALIQMNLNSRHFNFLFLFHVTVSNLVRINAQVKYYG